MNLDYTRIWYINNKTYVKIELQKINYKIALHIREPNINGRIIGKQDKTRIRK